MTTDLRVLTCPGCGEPARFWKYRWPPELVKRGKHPVYATAALHEVDHGHWRGGCCIGPAARAWEAGRRG